MTHVGQLFDFDVRPRPTGWRRLLEPLILGSRIQGSRCGSPRKLLRAVRLFLDRHPQAWGNVRVRFIGRFPSVFEETIHEFGLENVVERIGYLPHRRALRDLLNANVVFLMQAGEGSRRVVVPASCTSLFWSGNAILGMLENGEAGDIIRAAEAGVVVSPSDTAAIQAAISAWYARWESGKPLPSAREIVRAYTRRQKAAEMAAVLDRVG